MMALLMRVSIMFLTALSLSVCAATAQTSEPQSTSAQARIFRDLQMIQIAEQQRLSNVLRGALWEQLASEYLYAAEFLKAEDAYYKALHLMKNATGAEADYAGTLEGLSTLYLIYGRVDEAERIRKQALAVREKLGNSFDIGLDQIHLANVAIARRQFKKAERLSISGVGLMESSPNPPRAGILSGLITVTYARCSRGHCGEGLASAKEALTVANSRFEPGSAAVGFALETLGYAEWKTGEVQEGEKAMLRGIQILRAKLVPSDPRLRGALLQYREYLFAANRRVEAQEINDEVDRTANQTGTFCSACTVSVDSLSKTLR